MYMIGFNLMMKEPLFFNSIGLVIFLWILYKFRYDKAIVKVSSFAIMLVLLCDLVIFISMRNH